MADLIARALGRAALRKVAPEQKEQLLNLHRDRAKELAAEGIILYEAALGEALCTVDIAAMQAREHEQKCFDDLAAVIGAYYPDLLVFGVDLRERLIELGRSDNRLSRLRLKYGWHDAAKLLPNHSRHVVIWTNRGEYRAYYDHVHDCWRTTRDGLRITHWREQCGPEDWPAAE